MEKDRQKMDTSATNTYYIVVPDFSFGCKRLTLPQFYGTLIFMMSMINQARSSE